MLRRFAKCSTSVRPPMLAMFRGALLVVLGLLSGIGCDKDAERPSRDPWSPPSANGALHPVTITNPPGTGELRIDAAHSADSSVGIPCATCHAGGDDSIRARAGDTDNHANIELQHGDLACASCHDAESPDQLRLASGVRADILDSVTLCSQCHGQVRESYDHGAHGGMRGYWDLQRGPRERNTCVACHSAHAPAMPQILPAPRPNDQPGREHHHGSDSLINDRYAPEQATHE